MPGESRGMLCNARGTYGSGSKVPGECQANILECGDSAR